MAIKRWHVGKLVLLWAWGTVLIGVTVRVLDAKPSWLVGYALIFLIFVVPITLSVLTWRWLGGREE
jgi:hypothetical protein